MTISKKVSVLALSLILGIASLSGCGNAGGTAGATPASAAPSGAASQGASSTPEQVEKELYEFTIFGSGIGNELKKADNAYIAGVEKALNLKLNVEIPPASSYVESLQMMIASGQYAELFNFPDGQDKLREDAAKNSIIIPINQYLENCPNLMQYTYDISWNALKVLKDDNIYGVPRTSIARADGFVVRKDWLEKVGFDFKDGEYMTLDQLEEMATLITFNDPDGNEMILIRGKCYPVARLHRLFNIEGAKTRPEDGILVLLEGDRHSYCLFVDSLIGEQQTVIKPLPPYITRSLGWQHGIAGCTILGDGSVSLILDVNGLLE